MEAGRMNTRLERLCDYLWKNQRMRFEFGEHDCGLFASRWIDTEMDTDYTRLVITTVRRVGLAKVRRRLREPGAYEALVTEVTGVNAVRGDKPWAPGSIAVFRQDDGTETLGVLSTRLIHAPGAVSLVGFDASRTLCHWSPECLKR
jgi:hypothetical protein